MLRDLKDAWGWIQQIVRRIERLESGAQLGNSSITKGRMRFIGGTLRVDSGGRVEIVGYLQVEGTTSITGPVTISGNLNVTGEWRFSGNGAITGDVVAEGKWTQNGAWEFNGPGDIAGDVDVTGDLDLTGNLEVLGDGRIKVGNVLITPGSGGKVTVGVGAAQVVLDGQTGKVNAGKLTIDPTEGDGAIIFDNGAQVFSHDDGGQIEMFTGGTHVTLTETQVAVSTSSRSLILVEETDPNIEEGIYVVGVPDGAGGRYLGVDDDNRLVKLASGGPGNPGTPGEPGDNAAGYIYPVDPNAWTLGDDYAAHVARGSAEPGIDWWCPPGTPIWAPGPGTIVDTWTSTSGDAGRYVTLVTDAGDWFRFLHNSTIEVSVGQTVTQGQVLAYSGGSGKGSEAGYGPHTHVSFKRGYTGLFPGASALDDFYAYMLAA
ncbi:M23 family metallopeptidase [Microbacterium oryzae]|uniref:M23 family metallopeptidase n=1 Tax=Microbacterium oryzae TaxID=743009 RepID=UPI0025B020EF|nr:M23 family metallopeptidase [Microbacterium oryzae]MDN3309554.1 M23 family metallopeptidase [Microbacterium oryzae]